ncbi:MAG: 1-(5-phosphoribosyl)-5-[(5-phosphoribosylamino)methylideneamino]imidazole-4-carboxamide isomerase [Cyanobacteria bacterium P01_A01_bin.135]
MDVIPAIDLLDNRCVRLYQGDYQQSEVFSEDPLAVAQQWAEQGATRIHLVDLDGAKTGEPTNHATIEAIAAQVGVPVQVGGGIRSQATAESLLSRGIDRIILGTVAVENPDLVKQLCQRYPGRIAVGIDARNGKVATRGWIETSTVDAIELAQQMASCGAATLIYTDIHRDGTLQGPNKEALRAIAEAVSVPIIASGGISSVRDLLGLLALEATGVSGAIVGRALYSGDLNLKEALQAVGPGRLQDIPPDFGSSTFA